MDYKYIEQLLERYWNCETTLEEEEILRTFFSQRDVPVGLMRYRDLFCYQLSERRSDVLGDDFSERVLALVGEPRPVKARRMTIAQKLMPLFKAAAIVAIFLTLGNAAQVAFRQDGAPVEAQESQGAPDVTQQAPEGRPVALGDTVRADTMKKSIQDNAMLLMK